MTSSPIISWQTEGEKVEAVTDFIFLGSKIIMDSDCSHEINMLASLKKSYDKPRQYIKKQRHHFANKGPYTPSYSFSSSHVWTIKKVEHQRTWTARRSNQSIPKETNTEIGLNIRRTDAEAKVPVLGHLLQRADSLEKTWMLRKAEGKRRRGQQRVMVR